MLKIGYLELNNPLAIASASQEISRELGGSNGSPGLIILGRFDLHQVAPSAVRSRMERIPSRSALGFSTFGGDLDDLAEAAGMAAEEGWLLEVELPRAEGIDEVVGAAKGEGATLSLRLRPNGLDDLSPLAREAREGGADLLHLDLCGLGPAAPKVVRKVSDGGAPPLLAMAEVGDFEAAKDLLSMGADMISLSERADPEFVGWLAGALKRFQELVGWYNAPKHICSGGDLRGIAFCCPPVKNCPLLAALKKMGISPREFIEKKIALTRGTLLEAGDGTCFGSLAWCCKITKPCFMRDAVLVEEGIAPDEYMRLKKKLAEDLLKA